MALGSLRKIVTPRIAALLALTLLTAAPAGAQITPDPVPAAPSLNEIVYPLEGSAPGTGAKPGEQLTLKGAALRDPAAQNPKPTKVSFTAPDPADAKKLKPVEVDPDEIDAAGATLKVTVPAQALAGSVIVQWGSGDTAVKSKPASANIRFNDARFLPGGIDEYQYFNSSTTDTQQFFPDNRLAYKGGMSAFTGLKCVDRFSPDLTLDYDRTGALDTAGVPVAAGTDCFAQGNGWDDPWYAPAPGGPRMRCVRDYQQCANGGWQRHDLDYPVNPDMTLGAVEVLEGESVRVASGQPLRSNRCNDTVELRKTNPDGSFSWDEKLDYKAKGVAWYLSPWNGPGGHAFFATNLGIARFRPDGSFQDFAPYSSALTAGTGGLLSPDGPGLKRLAPAQKTQLLAAMESAPAQPAAAVNFIGWRSDSGQAVDCAGNNWWVEFYDKGDADCRAAPRRLMKLPFNATQPVTVDGDLRASMAKNGIPADNVRLTGINRFGDIYLESHWRSSAWTSANQTCLDSPHPWPWFINSPADDGEFMVRHPKVRAEGCHAPESAKLVRFVQPGEAGAEMSMAPRVIAGETCSFTQLLPGKIPIGHLGAYGVQIESRDGQFKCTAVLNKLTLINRKDKNGALSCTQDGVEINSNAGGVFATTNVPPLFNVQCLLIPGSQSCGEGCRELLFTDRQDAVSTNVAGKKSVPLLAVHSGTLTAKFEYFWPADTAWGEHPDGCDKQTDGRWLCKGEQPVSVSADEHSVLSHGGSAASSFDAALAYWADQTGIPGPLLKATLKRAGTLDNPTAPLYEYQWLGSRFGDFKQKNWDGYFSGSRGAASPFYESFLLPHLQAPVENGCQNGGDVAHPPMSLPENWPSITLRKKYGEFLTFMPGVSGNDYQSAVCHPLDRSTNYPDCGVRLAQLYLASSPGRVACKSLPACDCTKPGALSEACMEAYKKAVETSAQLCPDATLKSLIVTETSGFTPLLCPSLQVDHGAGHLDVVPDLDCLLTVGDGGTERKVHFMTDAAQTVAASSYGPFRMPYPLVTTASSLVGEDNPKNPPPIVGTAIGWRIKPSDWYFKRSPVGLAFPRNDGKYWDILGLGAGVTEIRIRNLGIITHAGSMRNFIELSFPDKLLSPFSPLGNEPSAKPEETVRKLAFGLTAPDSAPVCNQEFCPIP